MSAILIFMAGLAIIIGWWTVRQRLTSKPWLETGLHNDMRPRGSPIAPAKIGLGVFLAVVGALFALLISAYLIRMGGTDWWSMPVPGILWLNTAALAASSAALQWARHEVRPGREDALKFALAAATSLGILFLVGQVQAWRQLTAAGYILADNPANSFFYLITGMHGLHILGGLLVLGRTIIRALGNANRAKLQLSVDLCATYWHFMLAVWLVLFALFAGWANDFADLCRQLIT